MRSLRSVGTVLSAVATVALCAASASAQGLRTDPTVPSDPCGPASSAASAAIEAPRSADCDALAAQRTAWQLVLGLGDIFGIDAHGAEAAARQPTGPGFEYFLGAALPIVLGDVLPSAARDGWDAATAVSPMDGFMRMLMSDEAALATDWWQTPGSVAPMALEASVFMQALTRDGPVFVDASPAHTPLDAGVTGLHTADPSNLTSTPEPGSMALIVTGLMGLGSVRFRRRRHG